MSVSRIDLADCGSPEKLVIEILRAEPQLPIPVPIEDLAKQLGITNTTPLESEGYLGGLITNATKSTGVILLSVEEAVEDDDADDSNWNRRNVKPRSGDW